MTDTERINQLCDIIQEMLNNLGSPLLHDTLMDLQQRVTVIKDNQ